MRKPFFARKLVKMFISKVYVKHVCRFILNVSVAESPLLSVVPPTALAPDWLFVDQEKVDNSAIYSLPSTVRAAD